MLLGNQRSSLSDQALQQHYASMAQNQQSAGNTAPSGGMGSPPMGLLKMFSGGATGAGGGTAAAVTGTGASTGAATTASTAAAGGGGSGAGAALMSNPFTALAAVIAGSAIHDNNKGIASYEESLLGQAGGKKLDYYGGRNDGKTHGMLGKFVDQDGANGQSLKGITDFAELDFSNGFKNSLESVKSLFKGKLF